MKRGMKKRRKKRKSRKKGQKRQRTRRERNIMHVVLVVLVSLLLIILMYSAFVGFVDYLLGREAIVRFSPERAAFPTPTSRASPVASPTATGTPTASPAKCIDSENPAVTWYFKEVGMKWEDKSGEHVNVIVGIRATDDCALSKIYKHSLFGEDKRNFYDLAKDAVRFECPPMGEKGVTLARTSIIVPNIGVGEKRYIAAHVFDCLGNYGFFHADVTYLGKGKIKLVPRN